MIQTKTKTNFKKERFKKPEKKVFTKMLQQKIIQNDMYGFS